MQIQLIYFNDYFNFLGFILKTIFIAFITFFFATILHADEVNKGELLSLEYSDFTLAHRDKNKRVQILEFVPEGEAISSWSELLSLYIFNKQESENDRTNIVQAWQSSTSETCSEMSMSRIKTVHENGYETNQFSYNCSVSNTESLPPEWGIGKHIVGNDSDYFILKAWRTAPTKQQRKTWLHNLSVSRVCDTRTSEHACD
jgi:hypothetical protein